MPQDCNVTDLRTGFAAARWFLMTVFCLWFLIYLTLEVNDTDPRPGVSAYPDFAVHSRLLLTPALDFVFANMSMCVPFPLPASVPPDPPRGGSRFV